MSKAKAKSTAHARKTRKTAPPASTAFPTLAEIAEESARQRDKAFDIMDALEASLIEINGITEILLELGAGGSVGAGTSAIFGYLGHNMHMHHVNARGAFNFLHEYLHGPNGAPAAVRERLQSRQQRRAGAR